MLIENSGVAYGDFITFKWEDLRKHDEVFSNFSNIDPYYVTSEIMHLLDVFAKQNNLIFIQILTMQHQQFFVFKQNKNIEETI